MHEAEQGPPKPGILSSERALTHPDHFAHHKNKYKLNKVNVGKALTECC